MFSSYDYLRKNSWLYKTSQFKCYSQLNILKCPPIGTFYSVTFIKDEKIDSKIHVVNDLNNSAKYSFTLILPGKLQTQYNELLVFINFKCKLF